MKIRHATHTAALVAAGVLAATATAHAEPAAPQPVEYHTVLDQQTVVTTLEHGIFAFAADKAITIRDLSGTVLDTLPTTVTLNGQQLPLRPAIDADGRTLRLTPDVSEVDRTALQPIASPVENQLAMNDLINSVSIGTSVGSLVGTAIGAVLGIGVGLAVSGAACVVLSLGCVVAVLPIVSLVAAVGGLTGLVLGGGPTVAVALFEYVSTLRAEPGQSKYGEYVGDRSGQTPAAGQ